MHVVDPSDPPGQNRSACAPRLEAMAAAVSNVVGGARIARCPSYLGLGLKSVKPWQNALSTITREDMPRRR